MDEQDAEGVRAEAVQAWTPTASLLHSNGDAMEIATIDGRIAGLADLERAVAGWDPARSAGVCGLRAADVEAAAELLRWPA